MQLLSRFFYGTLVLLMCLFTNSFGQRTYQNPIITGMNPDPSICRVGDEFFLVTSTFEYFPGVPVYKSKDLVNWKLIGHALNTPVNCPLQGAGSSGGNYAPAIRYNDGIFYVTCTNYGGKGSQGAFYVTATNPEGPWSDPVWVGNWNVDPSIMFANDSAYWVSPDNNGSFMVGTIDLETGKFIKPLSLIASGLGGSSPEGPHMYKINGYYYLMSAEGGTGFEHREVIQRSKSPYGPFEPSPHNPVVSNMNKPESPFHAIGHADLIQLQDSSWWLVCLGIRPKGGRYHHLGRETFLTPIKWTEDGWPKGLTDGNMEVTYPAPNLPEHKWESDPIRDDFDSKTLALAWTFIRNPYEADWSLLKNPGYLQLYGSKVSLRDKDSPAFVGRRQTAFHAQASARIDFTPTASNEEAGLVIRGDDANHYDFAITIRDGKKVALLRSYLKDSVASENFRMIDDSEVTLGITATDLQYEFWIRQSGEAPVLIGKMLTKNLATEVRGGFIGNFIGMYASGNGKPNTNPANFDWFDYEDNPTNTIKYANVLVE